MLGSQMDDAKTRRMGDGVGSASCIKLVGQRTHVKLGGVNRNPKPPGDQLVRRPLSQKT